MDRDTFTRNELQEAVVRLGRRPFPGYLAGELLADILTDALDHREPECLNGAMYEDDNGHHYQFVEACGNIRKHWLAPGVGHRILFDSPKRPMYLMDIQLVRKAADG